MMCRDMTEQRLNEYADGSLPAPEREAVERHLAGCAGCREDVARLRALLADAARLPQSLEPPRDLWPDIERRIGAVVSVRLSARPTVRRLALAAAAVLVLVLGVSLLVRLGNGGWAIAFVEGTPMIGSAPAAGAGALRKGQWLETDRASRVKLQVGRLGTVQVEPGTRVRLLEARRAEQRLALARGTIRARIVAPPRIFLVETPSALAIDLGCAYTLSVDSLGNGVLHVTSGWVEFRREGRVTIVPRGAFAVTRQGVGPGTAFGAQASETLRRALHAYDFADGGVAALRRVLAAARAPDAVTLLNLVQQTADPLRGEVYDRLVALVPPPRRVTREGVLRLDALMLNRWWDAVAPPRLEKTEASSESVVARPQVDLPTDR